MAVRDVSLRATRVPPFAHGRLDRQVAPELSPVSSDTQGVPQCLLMLRKGATNFLAVPKSLTMWSESLWRSELWWLPSSEVPRTSAAQAHGLSIWIQVRWSPDG